MADYAHPEALVDTAWLAEHAKDAKVRVFEVDVTTTSYDEGHVEDHQQNDERHGGSGKRYAGRATSRGVPPE